MDDKQATRRGGAQEGIYLSSGDVGMAMENAPTVVFTFVCSPPPAAVLGNGPGGGVGNGTPGGLGGGGVAGVVYTGFAEVSMLVLRVGSFVGRYTIVVLETLRKSPFRGRFARLFRRS